MSGYPYTNIDIPLSSFRDRLLQWTHIPYFVERWEWLASGDEAAKKREFYLKYCGRTRSIWKSEYAELNPDKWSMPLYDLGNNTLQPSPFNNSIHLRNSKDGVTVDELYISPKISMHPPCVLIFNAYFPAFNTTNYPAGTYVTIGFEVNSGGHLGQIYELQIWGTGTDVTVTLRTRFGVDRSWAGGTGLGGGECATADFKTLITTDQWQPFILVLTRNRFALYQGASASPLAELRVDQDFLSSCTPYFANESSAIVSGVRLGQFQAYEIRETKLVRQVINVSSIAAGAYADSEILVLPKECALQVNVTYGPAATAGVRVYILACNRDGSIIDSENTTDAFAYFEPSFAAGATRTKTVNLDMLPKYCRIRVRNLDSANATGAVKVLIHEAY